MGADSRVSATRGIYVGANVGDVDHSSNVNSTVGHFRRNASNCEGVVAKDTPTTSWSSASYPTDVILAPSIVCPFVIFAFKSAARSFPQPATKTVDKKRVAAILFIVGSSAKPFFFWSHPERKLGEPTPVRLCSLRIAANTNSSGSSRI
jgi:hypothetical protein